MSDKRIVTYNKETRQWTLIDFDGTRSNFLSINDLRDWLDFMENQRG